MGSHLCRYRPVGEEAASRGLQAEDLEVVSRNNLRVFVFGLVVPNDADVSLVDSNNTGEDLVFVPQVLVHRIREKVPRLSAKDIGATTVATGPMEADELLRLLDRQHAEEHLIEEGEDGSVSSDAQRERENDG